MLISEIDNNAPNFITKIGMVFQRPNPFPLSIKSNITFGLKIHGIYKEEDIDLVVENSLKYLKSILKVMRVLVRMMI